MATNSEEYFKNWAAQYHKSAQDVLKRLELKQQEIRNAKSENIKELTYQAEILQETYYDCMETARILDVKAARERIKSK